MDFNTDIDCLLNVLNIGQLAGISTRGGWMLIADAANTGAVSDLLLAGNNPVLMLADERDLLQHVSALDLAVFDFMKSLEPPFAILFNGVIGVDEALPDQDGFLPICLASDKFCYHLVKRFRHPIVMIAMELDKLSEKAKYIARSYTDVIQNGFRIENFV